MVWVTSSAMLSDVEWLCRASETMQTQTQHDRPLLFGGRDVAALPGATVGNVDPATGIQCHHIELSGHFVV